MAKPDGLMSEVAVGIGAMNNPGRLGQQVGTANFMGTPPEDVLDPDCSTYMVFATEGDSQCYLGVPKKAAAIAEALKDRFSREGQDLGPYRLPPVAVAQGVSDGQLNGTDRMRYSLIGRETTRGAFELNILGSDVEAGIAVVACDKPPVGAAVSIIEQDRPIIMVPDGSIAPGKDPETGKRIDIVTGFQKAGPEVDDEEKERIALHACPGEGSCGGIFTYNTMQSYLGTLGMMPLEMVAPASTDPRRLSEFPQKLVDYMINMVKTGIKPSDVVTRESIRNAVTVDMAIGGSTNVALHTAEIARAAGFDMWKDIMTQEEFNELSQIVPVLTNARPYGEYSMVDIDKVGGLQGIVAELLGAGLLDGSTLTMTGETLQEQVDRLDPPLPDGEILYTVEKPYKERGGLMLLKGNLAPEGGAIIKVAGVNRGLEDGRFEGKARVFESESSLLGVLENNPGSFEDKDVIVIRYMGPRGAPGMPEMLDPTSRVTAICEERDITISLITDARFSGGSVGLVVGHIPEAYDGKPIALVEEGDRIVIDLNEATIDDLELKKEGNIRSLNWITNKTDHSDEPPDTPIIATNETLLARTRALSRSAIEGAGLRPF